MCKSVICAASYFLTDFCAFDLLVVGIFTTQLTLMRLCPILVISVHITAVTSVTQLLVINHTLGGIAQFGGFIFRIDLSVRFYFVLIIIVQ